MTLTAEEVVASTIRHQKMTAKERNEFNVKRAELEAYHDFRDDVCSIIKNSGVSLEDIHARCGPHPNTITKWMDKQVSQPRMAKVRSVLRILGYELAIVDKDGQVVLSKRTVA